MPIDLLKKLPPPGSTPLTLAPIADKNRPHGPEFAHYKWRKQPVDLRLINLPLDHKDIKDDLRFLCEDGFVHLAELATLAGSLTPSLQHVGMLSDPIGLFLSFRMLLCLDQKPKAEATFVVETHRKPAHPMARKDLTAVTLFQTSALPGSKDPLVPAKWARRVINLIERGFVRVWLSQNAPSRLFIEKVGGGYKEMMRNENLWGWDIMESSRFQLERAHIDAFV